MAVTGDRSAKGGVDKVDDAEPECASCDTAIRVGASIRDGILLWHDRSTPVARSMAKDARLHVLLT